MKIEKWEIGGSGGCIVSDTPNRHTDERNNEFYGGNLIAESIPTTEYAHLISAAPDMYEAIQIALGKIERAPNRYTKEEKINIMEKAIAKAEGKDENPT